MRWESPDGGAFDLHAESPRAAQSSDGRIALGSMLWPHKAIDTARQMTEVRTKNVTINATGHMRALLDHPRAQQVP